MKLKLPSKRIIKMIVVMFSAVSVLSAIIPSRMAPVLGTNVSQPSITSNPFDSISLILGIPGFIIALLELAGLLEWKIKHHGSRTPVVIH
jgi:hypothetical protein